MYIISNGRTHIGLGNDNSQTTVSSINKALTFNDKKKAENYRDNLKTTLRRFDWKIVKINNEDSDIDTVEEVDTHRYEETDLEKSGFDIAVFFKETIKTVSQLKTYAFNMRIFEEEYNKKIKDIRHYKRDIKTKLNAIQLQKLEQFEIQVERERYECKSNRIIAEIFLSDLSRLENVNYIEVVKGVKESEYKPEILTYDMLDEVVGKIKKK